MSDKKDPQDPQEQFKELIKTAVNTTNSVLGSVQSTYDNVAKPIISTYESIEKNTSIAYESAQNVYAKRKQYAPEIMVGTATLMGGYSYLRRGKIAAILGAAAGTGIAYSVVYDEFPVEVEKLPDIIFGKKE